MEAASLKVFGVAFAREGITGAEGCHGLFAGCWLTCLPWLQRRRSCRAWETQGCLRQKACTVRVATRVMSMVNGV